jgi:hypothetical protein
MIYIDANDKIIKVDNYCEKSSKIVNNNDDPGFLPLACLSNIILMSNYKLYKVIDTSLHKIGISDDFTDKFIRCNGDFYEIVAKELFAIPIVAKNSYCIVEGFLGYYYVNLDNKLMFYDQLEETHTFLDDDVDVILFSDYIDKHTCVTYKKNNTIIYSTYNNNAAMINSNIIDYSGFPIVKTLHYFALDSDGNLYKFIPDLDVLVIKKVLSDVVDFNTGSIHSYSEALYIIKSDHKMYNVNINDFRIEYIYYGCYFTKKKYNVKSANNVR